MALETGTYISDLVATNPPGTDLKSQGDDHLRLIKSTVKTTFPNITGAVTPTHIELNYVDGVTSAIQTQLDGKPLENVVHNGDFQIWQEATTFTSMVANTFIADRWSYVFSGTTAVVDGLQSTDVPTVAQSGFKTLYSLQTDVTTADAAIAAGDYAMVRNAIEGYDFNKIAQRDFTLSFWVKAAKTGIHCVAFKNSGADRTYIAEYTVNAADTWEYKTITVSASPTAGTWDYTSGVGLQVSWALACGSTFQTTAGSWQTGNFVGTANQVNELDSTANNFRIALVKIEPGSIDTFFDALSYDESLAICQRYYWKGLPANALNFASYAVGAVGSWTVRFPKTMRATPTLSIDTTGITLSNTGAPTVSVPSLDGCRLLSTSTAIISNANFTFAAANFIEADARI